MALDVLTVRVNTQGFQIADNTTAISSLQTLVRVVTTVADDAAAIARSAQATANAAQTTADDARRQATAAQTTANAAQSTANSASSTASAAQSTANTAQTTANAAQTAANAAQITATNAASAASQALTTANIAANTASSAQTTASQALTLGNQIFAKQNSIIYGWGVMNNTNTLFQMQSNLSSSSVMMTNTNFTASRRLGNGNTLPYTQFWIRSRGEIGQPSWPAARVRTGAWILLLTGGSGGAQQLTIDPFYIRDYT